MNKQTRLSAYVYEVIQAVKENIDQKPFDKKNILDFANDTGIGRNLLQKGFKIIYGSRVKEYQKKKRMEAAANMLDEDRLTIQQIASKCGYHSQSNFTRAFKEIYGLTPTEWKYRVLFPSTVSATV